MASATLGCLAGAPDNVTFTGFLSERDYVNLLFAADAVLALTTAESCMLCGCYEALAARKALLTSDTSALREYFDRALFVQSTPESIARGIREFVDNRDRWRPTAGRCSPNCPRSGMNFTARRLRRSTLYFERSLPGCHTCRNPLNPASAHANSAGVLAMSSWSRIRLSSNGPADDPSGPRRVVTAHR